MILEAILLTVAEISADGEAKLPVAIFPQMQIDTGIHRDGVGITSPTTNSQVRLTGNVDYGICTYTLGQCKDHPQHTLSCPN